MSEQNNNNLLIIRTNAGERSMRFSNVEKYALIALLVTFMAFVAISVSHFLFGVFGTNSGLQLSQNERSELTERIDTLMSERAALSQELEESRIMIGKLAENIGQQQDLLFEVEREKNELALNLTGLRNGFVENQTRIDALKLQIDAQNNQLAAMDNGEGFSSNSTLSTITATLSETAIARDEARQEVQRLRNELLTIEESHQADNRKRDILFSQIEKAVEESLVPLQSTLQKTGLNVNSLLNDIRKSHSGAGGVDLDASFNIFGESETDAQRVENFLGNLDQLSTLSYAIRSLPIQNPMKSNYRMSSPFGYRVHPVTRRRKLHAGQDMAAPTGTPVYAPGDGVVSFAGRQSGYGNTIKIKHSNGIETLYAHLSSISVKQGQQVTAGARIGKVGSTGLSTGPHLHYEIRIGGNPVNPMNFIRASQYVQ